MHDHVVDKRAVRIQHRRVLRLSHRQLRRIVHAKLLHRGQRARPAKLDIAHVRHVEQPNRRPHRHVLGDQAGVLHRHVPSAKVDHLGLCGAVGGVQCSFAKWSLKF